MARPAESNPSRIDTDAHGRPLQNGAESNKSSAEAGKGGGHVKGK